MAHGWPIVSIDSRDHRRSSLNDAHRAWVRSLSWLGGQSNPILRVATGGLLAEPVNTAQQTPVIQGQKSLDFDAKNDLLDPWRGRLRTNIDGISEATT